MQKNCNSIELFKCDIDPRLYIANCVYDLCSDGSNAFQEAYLCSAMATYALACAKSGEPITNWITQHPFKTACQNSNFGQCSYGQVYRDCTTNYLNTCKSILNPPGSDNQAECVQGI